MGTEFYVAVRWGDGTFRSYQLLVHAGTSESEAKKTMAVIKELADMIGLADPEVQLINEHQLIHHIHLATDTAIVEPFGMVFVR